jgi:hypothetical protein
MTIYDIPSIVSQSLPNLLTQKNIMSGFWWHEYGCLTEIYFLMRISCLLLWLIVQFKILRILQ